MRPPSGPEREPADLPGLEVRLWQPGGVPQPHEPAPPRAATVTREYRDDDDDVVRARAGVRNARPGYGPPPRRGAGGAGGVWRGFVHRYGWRAYALPVLIVVTIVALLTTSEVAKRSSDNAANQHPAPGGVAGPPTAGSSIPLKADAGGTHVNQTALKAAALPPGAPYPVKGSGTFRVLAGTSPKVGSGQLYRYSVEVENGITGVDLNQFQQTVVSTLSDPRSWSGHGVALQRVDSGPIDFHVTLVSSMTVRDLCGYTIPVETSCYAPAGNTSPVNRVVFNVARWVRGSAAYVGDLATYRVYMINHEDGHALGHQHAHQCLPGGLAPVMMQQTFGLRSAATGKFCEANPWPYPPGAAGAPGAEQPDTPQNDEYGMGD